jgi:protein TonB
LNSILTHHFKTTRVSDHLIIGTIVASIVLHVLATIVIPNVSFEPAIKPEPLKIEIIKIPEPVVEKPKLIEPPKPKPVVKKVEPKKQEKPIQKVIPKPTPVVLPEVTPEPPAVEPETKVIAVTAKPDAPPNPEPPVPVVAPSPPPPPPGPSSDEINSARDAYKNALWSSIAKHKNYPRIAKMRGWQGDVMLELSLDGNGQLLKKSVIESSGYDVLDEEALRMVEKAVPFAVPPSALRGNNFTIRVPVPFKLVSN